MKSNKEIDFDVVVVGAGFGGLSTALSLTEQGVRVGVFEQLNYPGGCASTFHKDGYTFEAGATLFAGFGSGQLFDRWIQKYSMPVVIDRLDPIVTLRTPELSLVLTANRDNFWERLTKFPEAPVSRLHDFRCFQQQIADKLWSLFDTPSLLPPWTLGPLSYHLRHLPSYWSLIRVAGRSMDHVLHRFGLHEFAPLRIYLDALCQITLQCSVKEAEAPFALASMDYFYRGVGHVRGGIGQLAQGMLSAIARQGGQINLANRVSQLKPMRDGGFCIKTRSGEYKASIVVANLLPQTVQEMLGEHLRPYDPCARLAAEVATGWGAAMLYVVLSEQPQDPLSAQHIELVGDTNKPFIKGNHVFCSISGQRDKMSPPGQRTMTVSTHVPMQELLSLAKGEQGVYIQSVQTKMKQTIAQQAPEWSGRMTRIYPASPRTFARFTGRTMGYVGGVPRRSGWSNYQSMVPPAIMPGLYLVGDSLFPGQSILATALGGVKLAERLVRVARSPRAPDE
ncbi:MAG: NAD(P)-binding protein [Myxococcales bacterium]|nr:NAD(P)-binding protein [Myxococcales bacterium]